MSLISTPVMRCINKCHMTLNSKWCKERHLLCLFICSFVCMCVCSDPVLNQDPVCFKLWSVGLRFSLMAYLFQQMYSSLLHSCIPHVFTLFNIAVSLKKKKGAPALVELAAVDWFAEHSLAVLLLLFLQCCSSILAILGAEMSPVG